MHSAAERGWAGEGIVTRSGAKEQAAVCKEADRVTTLTGGRPSGHSGC